MSGRHPRGPQETVPEHQRHRAEPKKDELEALLCFKLILQYPCGILLLTTVRFFGLPWVEQISVAW